MPNYCSAWNTAQSCSADGTWAAETCSAGCYGGACSATACADECALGQAGVSGTCQLWSLSSNSFVTPDPAGSMHDRARDYDARLFASNLPNGGVAETFYADASFSQVVSHADLADSAIWTGSALAAESWRYQTTREPAAADRMAALAAMLHQDFAVTGAPGYMARYSAPAGSPMVPELEADCSKLTDHCNVSFQGGSWSWMGNTSRDQYSGAMLGLFLAYQATADETLRDTIRADVVAVAEQLATVRTNVSVHIAVGTSTTAAGFDTTMTLENIIPVPSETADGRIWLVLDATTPSASDLYGARQFLPNLSTALDQVPGFSWLPAVNEQSSAMMLGAFMQMALAMTDGVPGYQSDYDMINAYYQANADAWIADAESWAFSAPPLNCGGNYFGTHIAYISTYAWAVLETDPTRQAEIRNDVLASPMWAALSGHKNSYFAFLWGGPLSVAPSDPAITAAAAELGQFPPGPRVNVPVNQLANYPNSTSCKANGQPESTEAVEVGVREPDDFIWQRDPWNLFSAGNAVQVFSGADYLAAYWAGRSYGFLPDDQPGTCTRWSK